MSRERRNLSQRKIRRIKTPDEEISQQLITKGPTQEGLKPNTKMYYTKVVFGLSNGALGGISFLMFNISPDLWFLFLFGGLAICIFFIRQVLNITQQEIDNKRVVFSGTTTYALLFIVISSLIWMIPGPRI